jgi:hypothetical protein
MRSHKDARLVLMYIDGSHNCGVLGNVGAPSVVKSQEKTCKTSETPFPPVDGHFIHDLLVKGFQVTWEHALLDMIDFVCF